MEHPPESEPGVCSSDNRNLEDMTIQDLVSVLRIAFLTQDFDKVEEVLVNRDKRLHTDILRLQEIVDLEKLTRFQAEEDLRNREELCQRGKRAQNNYEKLLGEVKKNGNFADRETIGELRKKNNELEFEVRELEKLKEKWVDDSNALSELRVRVDVLENDNNALRVKNSELEKSMEKNTEALSDDVITDSEDSEHCELMKILKILKSDWDYEPSSKRSKNEQGSSSSSMKNINVVAPPSNVQKQMETQSKEKRKMFATDATSNSLDSFHFISLVHQERYSKFLTTKEFWFERNIQLEWGKFSYIHGMIVSRGWVKLTLFAKEASQTLAKEFFANAYQHPAKENGDNKNDLIEYTSFVRGKKVPFEGKIINELFGLENYEHCSFEARVAKGSNIDRQEVLSTLYRSEVNWVRKEDGTLRSICSSNLTPIAIAWVQFINDTLLPCSNVSVLEGKKLDLLIAIIRGEPVNVGRLLANHLRVTANCSSPTSYINHASLISKLCERVGVYPTKNEEMVKPLMPITVKLIETCNITVDPHGHKIGYNIQGPTNPWTQIPPSISGWPNSTPGPTSLWKQIPPSISRCLNPASGPTNPWRQIPPSISGYPNLTPGPTNPWRQIPPSISGWPNPTPGPTNQRGKIPSSNSGWPNPTLGPTNPRGQIPPSKSSWPNPTPGPTNLRGQIPPSNSG